MAVATFQPVRAQWWGIRTANPAPLTQLGLGAWWYRSDLRVYAYWDGTIVHYFGGVGGAMFYGTAQLIVVSAGNYVMNVNLSAPWAPTTINRIVSVYNVSTSPVTDPGIPTGIIANPPAIGFTLIGVGAGTTLTFAAIGMGW
jgi:hypothetical protein